MTESELEWQIRMAECHTEAAEDEAITGCFCQRCINAAELYRKLSKRH